MNKSRIWDWVDQNITGEGLALTFLCMVALMTCNGQPPKGQAWKSLIQGTDTIVQGPLKEFDLMYAYRISKNKDLRDCKVDLLWKDKEIAGLYAERAKWTEADTLCDQTIALLQKQTASLISRNDKLATKVKRRKPVVYVCLGVALGVLLQNAVSK